MCLYPKIIQNKKYTVTKKNGGIVPILTDERVKYVPIGCTRCIECRKQKAREWQVRLLEDIKQNTNGKFITLTFSNESINKILNWTPSKTIPDLKGLEGYELDNAIAKRGVRLFLERWRKEYGKSLRHWFITELGHQGTENIHIHGIVWTDQTYDDIERHWQWGYIWPRKKTNNRGTWIRQHTYVNNRTVNYIIKYVTKQDFKHPTYQARILCSKGIGRNYTMGHDWKQNRFNGKETNEVYRTSTGHKISMPIYWRNKIYSEEEREKLWLYRLDKNERWVQGNKINMRKKGWDKQYYALLEHFRKINKELGFGDDKVNWEKAEYEKQRRNLLIKERLSKAA